MKIPAQSALCLPLLLLGAALCGPAAAAEKTPKPAAPADDDLDMLEFLGSIDDQNEDQDWLDFLRSTDIDRVAKAKPPAPRKEGKGT